METAWRTRKTIQQRQEYTRQTIWISYKDFDTKTTSQTNGLQSTSRGMSIFRL